MSTAHNGCLALVHHVQPPAFVAVTPTAAFRGPPPLRDAKAVPPTSERQDAAAGLPYAFMDVLTANVIR